MMSYDYDTDGPNFQTAILPEARVARFYIDEGGEKVPPQDTSLSLYGWNSSSSS